MFMQVTMFIQLTKNHFSNFVKMILRSVHLLVYITFVDIYFYLQ